MKIEPGTFAEACYEQNSISELRAALYRDADQSDCEQWGLTPEQWREQIALALFEKASDKNGKVEFEGREYALLCEPSLTNNVFPGWFGDAKNGEAYVMQWGAGAVDADGIKHSMIWEFDAVRGEEPDDDSNWPWDAVYGVERVE